MYATNGHGVLRGSFPFIYIQEKQKWAQQTSCNGMTAEKYVLYVHFCWRVAVWK